MERRPPGVTFATADSASAEIDFPESGNYIIGVEARGSSCQGVYPIIRVTVDNEPLVLIATSSNQWQSVSTFGHIQQGRHKVTVAFINDQSHPPDEDRNLDVDKVLIARTDENDGVPSSRTHPRPPSFSAVAARSSLINSAGTPSSATPARPCAMRARSWPRWGPSSFPGTE